MITKIEVMHYRSLERISQRLDKFHVLVGPNGSGKTSFLDVPNVVHNLILSGPSAIIREPGIRRESLSLNRREMEPSQVFFGHSGNRVEFALELKIPSDIKRGAADIFPTCRYEVAIEVGQSASGLIISNENVWLAREGTRAAPLDESNIDEEKKSFLTADVDARRLGWVPIARKRNEADFFYQEPLGEQAPIGPFSLGPGKSAFGALPEDPERFPVGTWIKNYLGSRIRFIELSASRLGRAVRRVPSRIVNSDGSSLASVIANLQERDPDKLVMWTEHVRTAIPSIKRIESRSRPDDNFAYILVSAVNGMEFSGTEISAGTLALLALTIIPYTVNIDMTFSIEEPENGIHPRSIQAVYESLNSVYSAQVMCSTHSPQFVALNTPESLLVFKKDGSGRTVITKGSELDNLKEWQKTVDLGTYFASGILDE